MAGSSPCVYRARGRPKIRPKHRHDGFAEYSSRARLTSTHRSNAMPITGKTQCANTDAAAQAVIRSPNLTPIPRFFAARRSHHVADHSTGERRRKRRETPCPCRPLVPELPSIDPFDSLNSLYPPSNVRDSAEATELLQRGRAQPSQPLILRHLAPLAPAGIPRSRPLLHGTFPHWRTQAGQPRRTWACGGSSTLVIVMAGGLRYDSVPSAGPTTPGRKSRGSPQGSSSSCGPSSQLDELVQAAAHTTVRQAQTVARPI